MKDNLIEILKIQSHSKQQFRMFAYLIRQVKKLGCEYYTHNGNIYATKGSAESFPCLVAHMDTVHNITDDLFVLQVGNRLTGFNRVKMSQTGIGGDDKVGIYIALECLRLFDNIKIAFFRDEEIGCLGSYEPDEKFFADCGFVLQCDRKGYGDFVTSASGVKLSDKTFQKDIKSIIKSYGYKFTQGMMTDVMALKESGIDCAMANISCGYYNPHMNNEYIDFIDVSNCLDMVKQIIFEVGKNQYICKYEYADDYSGSYGLWGGDAKGQGMYGSDYWNRQRNYEKEYQDYLKGKKTGKKKAKPNLTKPAVNEVWGKLAKLEDELSKKKIDKKYCDCCGELAKLTYVGEYKIDMCDKCIKAYVQPYGV